MTTAGREEITERTVRELGGEVWAELARLPEDELPWGARDRIIDVVMGVLARHAGAEIKNDSDLPVTPLPRSSP